MEGKENVTTNNLTSEGELTKEIFTEEIPKWGKVSLMFYIPDTCKEKQELWEQIRRHGGNVALFHEWFTYQIACPEEIKDASFDENYCKGTIYSSSWISDSVKEGKLLPKEKYPLLKLGKGREFEYDKGKKQYTIREVVILFDWIKDKKLKNSKRTWQQMVDQNILICRSAESLKNFWKVNQKLTVEEWIENLLKKEAKYCHQYPNPIFPFDNVWIKPLETISDLSKDFQSVRKVHKRNDFEDEKTQDKKTPVIKTTEDLDENEDISPIKEELDFEISVVAGIDGLSSESESNNNDESKHDESQLEVHDESEDIKNEEEPEKELDLKCSQNSLSNFFDGSDSNAKNTEKPLKEKKDLLVGLLTDDLSNVNIPPSLEKENEKISQKSGINDDISSYMSIKNKLTTMAKKHGKKFEEAMSLFEQASCRYEVLEDYFEGKESAKNKMWKGLEDFVLNKPHMNEEAYNMLIDEKGEEEVQNRREFLNLK